MPICAVVSNRLSSRSHGCGGVRVDRESPDVEPKLPEALQRLTRNQPIAVVLVHGLEWTEEEVAALIGRSRSTVQTHLERGLARLRQELEVTIDV